MTSSFNALLINKNDNKVSASIKQISLADLPDEEVLVDVAYSTINYKDDGNITHLSQIPYGGRY